MLSRKILIGLLAATVLQFANAESTIGFASVSILDTLEITETNVVNFGAMTGEDGICTMDGQGALVGSNGSSCEGTGQVGSFVITGNVGQSINISVNADGGPSGLTFEPELISSGTATLAGGSTTALIGGQLALNQAPKGAQNLTYFITVNYN